MPFAIIAYIAIALTIGTVLTDIALYAFLGVDVHWALDLIISLLASSITGPLGIVAWILELGGVPMPMFVAGG